MELQGRVSDLQKQGLSLIAVSYDPVETLAKFSAARQIAFPLLSDRGSVVIRQYGLLNDTVERGTTAYGVPHPGTLMLNASRTVTARFFEDRYQERSTASSILVREGGAGTGPAFTASSAQIAVKGFASDDTVAPGSRVTLAFDITPGPRIHVYAPGATYRVVDVKLEAGPFVTTHETVYPASEIYHFVPLDEKVPVYQKPFRLTRDVTVAATREAREALAELQMLTFAGTLEYQACDDKICFPPDAIPFALAVKVRPLDGR